MITSKSKWEKTEVEATSLCSYSLLCKSWERQSAYNLASPSHHPTWYIPSLHSPLPRFKKFTILYEINIARYRILRVLKQHCWTQQYFVIFIYLFLFLLNKAALKLIRHCPTKQSKKNLLWTFYPWANSQVLCTRKTVKYFIVLILKPFFLLASCTFLLKKDNKNEY